MVPKAGVWRQCYQTAGQQADLRVLDFGLVWQTAGGGAIESMVLGVLFALKFFLLVMQRSSACGSILKHKFTKLSKSNG